MKKKLKLDELQISSFITDAHSADIRGGAVSVPNCQLSLDCVNSLPLGVCIVVASKNSSCP